MGREYHWAQALRLKGYHCFLCAFCVSRLCTEDVSAQLPGLVAAGGVLAACCHSSPQWTLISLELQTQIRSLP